MSFFNLSSVLDNQPAANQKYDTLCFRINCVLDKYKPIRGFRLYLEQTDSLSLNIVVQYRYETGFIPYSEKVPKFWEDMDEAFVFKNAEVMLRYIIKSSMTVEIERLFGYVDGSFNPL